MYSVHNYVLQKRYFIVCCIVKFHCLKCTKQFEPVIYFEWADLRSPTNKNAPKIQKCAHILLTKRGELWLCISIQKAIQFGVSCIKHQSNAFPIPLLLSQELKYEKTDNCVYSIPSRTCWVEFRIYRRDWDIEWAELMVTLAVLFSSKYTIQTPFIHKYWFLLSFKT